MKFISYNYNGIENVGILIEDRVMPLNDNVRLTFNSMIELIENIDEDLIDEIESIISTDDYTYLPLNAIKLLAPIPYPRRNVFCLGKNYVEHALKIKITKISDTGIPDYPIYFTKTATPAIAHSDQIKFSYQATS